MTIKELINRLQQIQNQDIKVVVTGYESGFDDIKDPKFISVYKKLNNEWWDGEYEQVDEDSGQGGNIVLLLPR